MIEFIICVIAIWLVILTVSFYDFKSRVLSKLEQLKSKQSESEYPAAKTTILPKKELYDFEKSIKIDEAIKNSAQKEDYDVLFNKIEQEFEESIKEQTPAIQDFKDTQENDFENLFFGNIFNKIGAVVLIIAFGIFLKFVSSYIEFTPLLKISTALVCGAGMIFGAMFLFNKEKMKNYAAALMGTGFGVLFVTTFCAFSLYQMLNYFTASIVAILLLIFSYIIAQKYKNISTFIIGLIGAYLNPVIMTGGTPLSVNFVFGYLIFVNLVSIVYVSRNIDKTAFNYANILISCLFVHIWSIGGEKPTIIFPFILWAMYLFFDMLLIKLQPKEKTYICWVNFFAIMTFLISNYFETEKLYVCFGTLFIGLVYGICSYFAKKYSKDVEFQYKHGLVFAMFAAIWFLECSIYKMLLFAITGTTLSFLSEKQKFLQKWTFAFIMSAFSMIIPAKAIFTEDIQNYRCILNERILYYLIPAACSYGVAKFCKTLPKDFSSTLHIFALSACYLFISTEINIYMLKTQYSGALKANAADFIKWMSFIILGFLYSAQIKRLGKTLSLEFLDTIGSIVYYISVGSVAILSFFMSDMLYFPIVNLRTCLILFTIVISLVYKQKEKLDIYGYIAIFLGFLLLNIESYKILNLYYGGDLGIITTSFWMVYAAFLILPGIFANIKTCKLAGIWIIALGLFKIFLFDIANVDPVYKIFAFLVTGVILMFVSYYYTKYKKDN